MSREYDQGRAEHGACRAAMLGCQGLLVAGGLGLAVLARGPLELLGTGHADTSGVGLVFVALLLLVLAVSFVAGGLRLDRSLSEAPRWRWTTALLLVSASAPFGQLGMYGLVVNVVLGVGAAVAVYAAHAADRIR
jgi:hypothetical protein